MIHNEMAWTRRIVLQTSGEDVTEDNPIPVAIMAGGAGNGSIIDGIDSTIMASVFDYPNANSLAVRLTDTNGDYVAASGGVQYQTNVVFTSGNTGNIALAIRGDVPANITAGDGRFEPLQIKDGLLWVRNRGFLSPNGDSIVDDTLDALQVSIVGTGGGNGWINDGQDVNIKATVFDYTNAKPLAVRLADLNGDYVSAGGGTEYVEDTVAPGTPTGKFIVARRRDALMSETSADGDIVGLNASDFGELYVKHDGTIGVTQSGVWLMPVTDNGGSLTVDGSVSASQSGTWVIDSITDPVTVSGSVTVSGTVSAVQSGTWDVGTVTNPVEIIDGGGSITVDGTVTANAGTGTFSVGGVAAHDAAASGNPILLGGYASTTAPAAVSTDGDAVRLWCDPNGRLQIGDGGGSLTVDGTVAATQSGTWNISTISSISGVVSVDDNGGSLTIDGNVGQSGTWTVQPGNTANTTPWLMSIHDGTTKATVRDCGSNDALNVSVVDASGNQIISFGGGSQFARSTASNASDVGTLAFATRQDTPGALSDTDGDYETLQVSGGLLWTRIRGIQTPNGDSVLDDTTDTVKVSGSVNIVDGTTTMTVLDYTNSNPVAVRLTDTNGDYIGTSASTEYTEDAAAPSTPTGPALMLRRRDTLSTGEVSADGDWISGQCDSKGELLIKHRDNITVDGTVSIGSTVTVTGDVTILNASIPVTQSGSWTVTANAGTGTFNVAGAVTVSGTATVTQAANWVVLSNDIHDVAMTTRCYGIGAFGSATAPSAVSTDGDVVRLWADLNGRLQIGDGGGSLTVDGTIAATQSGTWTMQPGNTANTTAWLVTGTGGTFPATQSGTWNITNISGTVTLPTGASTAAKQPALGTAGTASADVITIQGITSMTPILTTLSGTNNIATVSTVSSVNAVIPGTGATNLGKAEDAAHTTGDTGVMALAVRSNTAASTSGTDGDYQPLITNTTGHLWVDASGQTLTVAAHAVTNAGTFAVQAAQSGTWTMQPGNTANTTAWLVTGTGGTFPATQSGTWNITNVSGTITLPTGASTAAKQPALGTAGSAAADVLTVQGIAAMTPFLVTLSGTNNIATVTTVTTVTTVSTVSDAQVQGKVAHDAVSSGNPILLGGYAKASAPADVSADGDAVRAWHLLNGAQATVLTAAGALIGGDAANGLDVDVTRLPSLVAGTAIIGKVGIDQTTPGTTNLVSAGQSGTWNITNVSGTVSLPTGAATASKQPALGTAGTASTDVITIQGIASMTPIATTLSEVVAGTGATNLGKAEDAAHTTGDTGVMALAVRSNTAASTSGTDGDYQPLITNTTGHLWVDASGQLLTVAAHAVTNAGTFAVQAAQSGTWNITNVSGTVSLPTGAATAVKQPALGTAGVASTDVITVQGIASMTPFLVTLSGTNNIATVTTVTTVSTVTNVATIGTSVTPGTGAAHLGKAEDAAHTTGDTGVMALAVRSNTAASTSGTDGDYQPLITNTTGHLWVDASGQTLNVASHAVTNAGTFAVQAAQSGTWTIQPGNTANTTAWLVTGTGGTFPATQSGTWNITNISGTITLPTGASTAAKQPALGTAGTASADVITVQGIAAMTPFLVTLSGTNNIATVTTVTTVSTVTNVATIGTSVTPGTGAAHLGKAEDAAHTTGDTGVMALAVRSNTAASTSGTDGDYQPLITNTTGHLWVDASGQTLTVAAHAVTNAGTFAVQAAQSGTWTIQPGNTANTTAWLVTGTGGTFPATQSGTWNITNISGTVTLPTGASTAAKQPALGTAGTASADVITIQGITAMTPILTTLSGTNTIATVTNVATIGTSVTPGTAAANLGKAEDAAHTTGDTGVMALAVRSNTAASTSGTDGDYQPLITNTTGHLWVDASGQTLTVSNVGTFAVQSAQSGTWTVQPGNTANTTAWLVTGTGGTFPATQSGTWNISNISGTVSLPTGAAIASKQPALGTAGTASADVITIQGITAMTPILTTLSGTNNIADAQIQGKVAHDGVSSGNPILSGGYAKAAAPADVSADGDAVRAWYLLNGAQATVVTAAGALIGGDAANGLDVDVTRLPALVAGSALIGKVGIDQTTPGTTNLVSAAQSGTWTVQPGNTANTTPWLTKIHDGTLFATVRDCGTSDALNVAIVDASGNQITSFAGGSGGTQYDEDVASAGGEKVTLAGAIRQDTPSATTSADGDYANLKTDSVGRLWIAEGQTLADNAGFTDGTSKVWTSGYIYDEVAGTALTENDVAAARINVNRSIVTVFEDGTTRGRYAKVNSENAIYVDPKGSLTPNRQTALSSTAVAIKASAGKLYSLSCRNPNASEIFLQIWNTAQGSVTVGVTTPVVSEWIPANGAKDFSWPKGLDFTTAITAACVTTVSGSTAPTTAAVVMFYYE